MRIRTAAAWCGVLALAACSEQGEMATDSAETSAIAPATSEPTTTTETASRAAAAPGVPGAPPAPSTQARATPDAPPPGRPMLAYAYEYSVTAPRAGVANLLRRHEQACQNAGPAVCQVVNAGSQQVGDGDLTAELTFRAAPAYVQRFRAGLARDLDGARGELSSSDISTEDLTRTIVDAEARLRAGRLLSARLEQLIASRPGNLQQLLEIERELARVQGEIDAGESTLAVMRARVAMSKVTMNYASRGALLSGADARPLAQAADDFGRNLAASAAAILTVLSIVLPWLLLLGLLLWAGLALARRGVRRSKPATASTAPVDFGVSPPGD